METSTRRFPKSKPLRCAYRGTILASGTAGDIDKLVLLSATTEANAYGILLDAAIDTDAAGTVTGSIAKSGTFRGAALIVLR